MIVLLYKETLLTLTNLTLLFLVQLSLFCKNLRISFPRKFQKGYIRIKFGGKIYFLTSVEKKGTKDRDKDAKSEDYNLGNF